MWEEDGRRRIRGYKERVGVRERERGRVHGGVT